jgi:predicted RND superfamily exporter protein
MGHVWNPFLRYPRIALAVTALLCLPLLLKLPQFQISSETRVLLEGDQRNLSSYEKVRQILADLEVVVVSLELDELFTPKGFDVVRRVSEAFAGQPGVVDVKSLTHSTKPVRQGMNFEFVPLAPEGPVTPQEMARLRDFARTHPLVRNVMVAQDLRHTVITVSYQRKLDTIELQRQLRQEVEAVLAPFRQEGYQFQTVGVPLIEEEIRSTLRRDIQHFVPAAAGLLVLILWLTFRSWRILLLVLFSQAVALILIAGLIELGGFRLNVFTVILFPLLTSVHLTLLAHMFTAYQRAYAASRNPSAAIEEMLRITFKSSAFATITTVIGLLSLTFSEVQQIRHFGWLGALGLSLVHCLTFGPTLALLKLSSERWLMPRRGTDQPTKRRTGFDWLADIVLERRAAILTVAGAALAFTALGVQMIRTDIRAVEFLGRQSHTRQAVEAFDRIYGGINVVQIELDSGSTNGINSPVFLQWAERVHQFAETRADLSGAYSYPQLLAMMNQIWEGDRPGSFRLPENPLLVNLFALALKLRNFPFLTALADPSFRVAYLVIRTRDMPSERYLALLDEIVSYAQQTKPPNVTVSAAKGIHTILEADRRIIRSQVNSAGITLAVIGLVLALLWRSLWLALLSLLSNAVPVALVIAVAGYLDVPLNSITVMVAAISLGIAVDDSIHFITHWRDQRRAGANPAEAVIKVFRVKGRPIVWTSVILMAIFSVFWFSSFPPVVHFGLLSAIAFGGALASVLFFLPAMLCLATFRTGYFELVKSGECRFKSCRNGTGSATQIPGARDSR